MARFQITKTGQGTITIPKSTWRKKNWKKGTELDIIEIADGSLVIREVQYR